MYTLSIGFKREDGEFEILATLNNTNGHLSPLTFLALAADIAKAHEHNAQGLRVHVLNREDAPLYVNLED